MWLIPVNVIMLCEILDVMSVGGYFVEWLMVHRLCNVDDDDG